MSPDKALDDGAVWTQIRSMAEAQPSEPAQVSPWCGFSQTSTGEILPVEPQEAQWLLRCVQELSDSFSDEKQKRASREAIEQKLEETGKPPIPDLPPLGGPV